MTVGKTRLVELLEDRRATWVLLLAALLIRLGALFLVANEPLTWDALGYFRDARFLAEGIPYSPKWPPGLPLYLSVFRLINPGEFIARASMLLWFLALALVGYRMTLDAARGERRSPEGTDESRFSANLFLLIFALYPLYIHQSVETLSQLPTAVGLLATAWLTLKVVRGARVGTAVVLGCVLGATVLIRPTSLILLVGVPIYIAVRTKRALPPLVSLLPAVGIVGLWLLVAHHMTDHFVFINHANTWNLFLGNNPYTPLYKTWWLGSHTAGEPGVPSGFSRLVGEIRRLPAHLQSGRYMAVAWEEIIGRPHVFLLRSLNRVRTYLATDSFTGAHLHKVYAAPLFTSLTLIALDALFYLSLAGTVILGLFAGPKALPGKDALTILLGVSLLYALPYFVSFSHPTYHIPVTPLLGVIAAVFAGRLRRGEGIWEKLKTSGKRRVGLWVTAAVFAGIQLEWLVVMAATLSER